MRNTFLTVLVFAVLLSIQPVTAEDNPMTIKRFKVLLTTGQRIEGHDAVLTSDGLEGISYDTSVSVRREHIRSVYRCTGTKALKGLAIGGGLGLFAGVMGGMGAVDSESHTSPGQVIAVFTGVGASIGLLMGLSTRSWTTVPLEANVRFDRDDGRARFVLSLSF